MQKQNEVHEGRSAHNLKHLSTKRIQPLRCDASNEYISLKINWVIQQTQELSFIL